MATERDDIARCPHCGWGYPDWWLNPVTGTEPTPPICAICALAHTNKLHGTNRQAFDGERAEDLRQDALVWRKTYPNMKPESAYVS